MNVSFDGRSASSASVPLSASGRIFGDVHSCNTGAGASEESDVAVASNDQRESPLCLSEGIGLIAMQKERRSFFPLAWQIMAVSVSAAREATSASRVHEVP